MIAVMENQKIPFKRRVASWVDAYKGHRRKVFGDVDLALRIHKELCDLIEARLKMDVRAASILDVGCGQTAKQVALFTAAGAGIIGIDVEVPSYKMDLKTFIQTVRMNGFERAAKSLARHLLFDRNFFGRLSARYSKAISLDRLDTRLMDASDLSFSDNSFDLVCSVSALEHIESAEAALKEINRVLKPSGAAYIVVHLFPSLTGGHNFDGRVPPWDHLFDNLCPANTYLNKLRLKDYHEMFARNFTVLDDKYTHEGEDLLNPSLEMRLLAKGYSRDELLTGTVTYVCRKKRV